MNFLRELWTKKESPEKRKSVQIVATKILFVFFLLLLFFYILSSVSASLTTPQVTTSLGQEKNISHKTSLQGTLEAEATTPIFVKEGAPILSVAVHTGDIVEAGQTLFTYDTQKVKEAIAQKNIDIKSTQVEYQVAVQNQANATERSQNAQSDSEEDLDSQLAGSNLQVQKAQEEMEIARKALNDAEKSKSTSIPSANGGTNGGGLTTASGSAYVPSGQTTVGSSGENTLSSDNSSNFSGGSGANSADSTNDESAITALRNDYRSKQYAYTEALQQRDSAMEKAERAVRDSQLVDATATVKTLALTLQLKQMELSILQNSIADGGIVQSPVSGIVSNVEVQLGQLTPATSSILLSDQSELLFKSEVSKKQLKYITKETSLTMKLPSQKESLTNLIVQDIRPLKDKTDTYELTVLLPQDVGILGETVSAVFTEDSEKYPLTVPLSALYSGENKRYYVYIIEQQNSILGEVTVVKKVDVKIEDQNEEFAAVTGAFTKSDKVVISSTTPLKDQMSVRVG